MAAVAVLSGGVGSGERPAAGAETALPGRGAYVGTPSLDAVELFSDWAGPPPTTYVSSFVPGTRKDGPRGFRAFDGWIEDVLPLLEGNDRRLLLSVPLVPAQSTLGSVIAGDGHRRLTRLGEALRAAGRGRSVIRLGWESNLSWPAWSAARDPVGYRRAFRAVVRTLRAAAPGLRFEWNLGCQPLPARPAWYPGDDYVNIVGQDCYAMDPDESDPWLRWRRALESVVAFAEQHSKRIAVSEWGQSLNDPGLVTSFLRWANAHSVTYHIYWMAQPKEDEQDTRLTNQPEAAAAYRSNGA